MKGKKEKLKDWRAQQTKNISDRENSMRKTWEGETRICLRKS